MSPLFSRPTAQAPSRWGVRVTLTHFFIGLCALLSAGCGSSGKHYLIAEKSLAANDFRGADAAIKEAEGEYGEKNRVLYGMDRGMTLHLAGDYLQSNVALEQSEDEVDRLYTRRVRTETAAFLTNDNLLPYEGDPYEQAMINVLKALNYALLGDLEGALVEARRVDHRLNVLSDRTKDKNDYREDGFARYVTGILYEAAGQMNDAFIAYRKSYEIYQSVKSWSGTGAPAQLQVDLLRAAEALRLNQELMEYQRAFPNIQWQSAEEQRQLTQVVVISYNGRAPRKEDRFLDVPVSMDALQLVLLNRALTQNNRNRAADTTLYALNGRVVRIAIPKLIPQKTHVPVDTVSLVSEGSAPVTVRTELAQNVTALADKALDERLPAITVKATARAATKFAMAEAATRGSQSAAGQKNADWVGLLVGLVAHGYAIASEEADKRSWRTLPDEIHLARVWVPPGTYHVQASGLTGPNNQKNDQKGKTMSLAPGKTVFIVRRVML